MSNFYAGHLPTMHFCQDEWLEMPEWQQREPWEFPPEGFTRQKDDRGKPLVVFFSFDRNIVSFCARPIVRVKMGRQAII